MPKYECNYDKRFCVDFILDRMREALLSKDDIMELFIENKKADYTVSIKGINGKMITGTIIIKEEE